MNIQYPTPEQVRKETAKLAPKGWTVSHEYPDQIGVTHQSLDDFQFISFGNVNGHFSFNDVYADPICGSMESLTDPKEIAESFWKQLGEFYPELIRDFCDGCELLEFFCVCDRPNEALDYAEAMEAIEAIAIQKGFGE